MGEGKEEGGGNRKGRGRKGRDGKRLKLPGKVFAFTSTDFTTTMHIYGL